MNTTAQAQPPIQANLSNLIDDVERDLLEQITIHLKDNTLPFEEAQQLAKEFLAELPPNDKHALLAILDKLGKKHGEAQAVYIKYAVPEYELERQEKLTQIATHLHAGNIEEALKVVKGGANG